MSHSGLLWADGHVDGSPGGVSHHHQVFTGVFVAVEACRARLDTALLVCLKADG